MQPWGRLRWRMASDTSGGNEGWRVDTVNITRCRATVHAHTHTAIWHANTASHTKT